MDAILLLKASVLLSVTIVTARLLRRASAVTRHGLWSVVFAAVLALPLLAAALPALDVPVPVGVLLARLMPDSAGSQDPALPRAGCRPGSSGFAKASTFALATVDRSADRRSFSGGWSDPGECRDGSVRLPPDRVSDGSVRRQPEHAAREARLQPDLPASADAVYSAPRAEAWRLAPTLLLVVWLTGTAAAATALFLSLFRVRRLARTAEEVRDPEWRSATTAIGARLGLRSPVRLLMSADVGTPMAGGVWRTAIFLPVSARTWSVEQREVVLAHEIAHLAGHDPLRHLVARLAFAFYWFHPLAWIAAREAAVAREQACDETVLALGTRRSVYARVLLDLADSMRPSTLALGALPMVERSLLENRLMAILNNDVRPVTRRFVLIPATGVGLLTLALAVAEPAVSASSPRMPVVVSPLVAETRATPVAARPEPIAPEKTAPPFVPQVDVARDSACWWEPGYGSSFSGSISTTDVGGRMVIREQVGTRGYDRVIQKSFGDLRLCMVAEGVGDRESIGSPSEWIGRASRVVLEARRAGLSQRMEFGRRAAGGVPTSWLVGGTQRPVDDSALQWRDRMLAVLDTTWESSTLRGEVSTLRGQISTIHGQRSTLNGEISTLRGEVSTMRGRISTARGHESTLRGQISTIRGHVSTLRGAISSEQGAISSLNASRYRQDDSDRDRIAARLAGHEAEITRLEREIRDYNADARVATVQRQIDALDTEGQVAAIEKEIRAFDLDGKVAAVERRIAALDVEGKVAAIERQITALDADRRTRQLDDRRDEELKRLEATIGAIR